MKKIALNLASSEGWTPSPPIPNHRRALLCGGMKSTSTSAVTTLARHPQMNGGSRYVR